MNPHAKRRDRLRESLEPDRVFITTSLANIRYLTGFSGSNAVLALGAGVELLGTDGRYVDQVAQEAPDLPVVIDRDTLTAVLGRLTRRSLIADASMTAGHLRQCEATDPEIVLDAGAVESLRAVKDDSEMAAIATACDITASALSVLATEIRVGMTEVALARRLEQLFGEGGAEDRSFDTIVSTGAHAAVPHHRPDRTPLASGDLLVIDCGALVDGYHADMTRTFIVGQEPDSWQVDLHAAVERAQRAAREAAVAGAGTMELDAVARASLAAAGLGDRFTHGLGHGVGLQIHEAPFLGPRATGSITAGMAITVEPGAYLPGRGGVRIEDTLAITDLGARVLTEASRALEVVGA